MEEVILGITVHCLVINREPLAPICYGSFHENLQCQCVHDHL